MFKYFCKKRKSTIPLILSQSKDQTDQQYGYLSQYLFLVLLFSSTITRPTSWTVFIYLEATDNLCDMAIKNLTDLSCADIHPEVNFIAQLHAYGNTAIRYKIEKQKIIPLETITLTQSDKDNFAQSSIWAFSKHPAEKNIVIIWNHGWGILEPVWNSELKKWHVEPDFMETVQCETCAFSSTTNSTDNDPKKIASSHTVPTYSPENLHARHKGFLFNASTKTYLRSTDLTCALGEITAQLQKKIDILGFDTCMGAQLEISYAIAPFAQIQIGCQNCELKDGWDYYALGMSLLPQTPVQAAATQIVSAYDVYYAKHAEPGLYTISAIDLHQIDAVTGQVDIVADTISKLANHSNVYAQEIKKLIQDTRILSPGFCFIPMYTDLYTFSLLLTHALSSHTEPEIRALRAALLKLQELIAQAVIANKTGSQMRTKAHGLSIYFPLNHIDSSYPQALFAQKTKWLEFLKLVTN